MKSSRYILLVIGILGIAAGIYEAAIGQEPSQYLLGLICGSSLIYGYFEMSKQSKSETK